MAKKILMIVLAGALLFNIGCDHIPIGWFSCIIDGEPYVAVWGFWTDNLDPSKYDEDQGMLFVARDFLVNEISFGVHGPFEEKTYAFTSYADNDTTKAFSEYMKYTHEEGYTDIYWSLSGTLTITSKTNRLKGVFNLTMEGVKGDDTGKTIEVTNGMFDLPHMDAYRPIQ